MTTTTIRAVFEHGVFRPVHPILLPEGETVELTVNPAPSSHAPTAEEKEYAQRLRAANSLPEIFKVMSSAPTSPSDEFDIEKLLNESRALTGFRMQNPVSGPEKPQ